MRNRTGRRRPVRVLGAFLVAVLAASGAVLALGSDVASASTSDWTVVGQPQPLRQNTQGNEFIEGSVVVAPDDSVTIVNGDPEAPGFIRNLGPLAINFSHEGQAISGPCIQPGTFVLDGDPSGDDLALSRPFTPGCALNPDQNYTITASISGAGSAWTFTLPQWNAGDTIRINAFPNDSGDAGAQCQTNPQPQGVNQSTPHGGNFVGFSNIYQDLRGVGEDPGNQNGSGVVPPLVDAVGVPTGPHFAIEVENLIPCSLAPPLGYGDLSTSWAPGGRANGTYQTLKLTLLDSGSNGTVTLGQGVSQQPLPDWAGPILFDVGYGTPTGPVHFTGSYNGGGFAVQSNVTVVGQNPAANVPPSSLQRSSVNSTVGGPISEFTITEDAVSNALPPYDGTAAGNPMPVNKFNPYLYNLQSSAPGAVCLVIDNGQGNSLGFSSTPAWTVNPNAGTAGQTATAGGATVVNGGNALFLPVTSSSNTVPTTWSTNGLSIGGTARADGPVYAWVYWVQGDVDNGYTPPEDFPNGEGDGVIPTGVVTPPSPGCPDPPDIAQAPAYTLGYVQLTTISELAPAIFGNIAESTAAQAVNHQFNYANGQCVSNTIGPDFVFGPSIFLARSDFFADGLGAAYAAGTVNSGVLLTPPNSLNQQTKDTIRLQGVSTVFITGRELAISEEVEEQLDNTIAFQCGGTQPRIDILTGQPQTLNVVRLGGENQYDTNALLASFVGAQPPAAFGAFGATDEFNSTAGMSTAGTAPGGPVNTALIVTGENFQDAAVASVPAYGGDFISAIGLTGPMPLIATHPDSLSPQALDSIFNQHIGQALVVGGQLAVSDNVMNQLAANGVYAIRIAGEDYTETSTQLASFELSLDLGFGYLNWDFDWASYLNRTAGIINQNDERKLSARTVLLARGDWYADSMAAAAVLSIHNGRWTNPQKFPLITTWSNSTLGPHVTDWLVNASLPVSGLTGQSPADGRDDQPGISWPPGDDCVNRSSNAFTIQPIGGPQALTNELKAEAVSLIGSGESLVLPGVSFVCIRDNQDKEPQG